MTDLKKLMIIEKFLKILIKEATKKNLIVKGIKETIKFIIRGYGYACILAKNCNKKQYKIAIKTLCWIYKVKIFIINDKKKLGRLCKILKRKKSTKHSFKIIPCSVCLILRTKPIQLA
mmetsp:Transcript_12731/g.15095  ORF Transcript_12731/g.15095 Transcript_12731/m.15095 type:complete len:118 (+) Transcript_12731:376-729(+)